jgi:nitrogen fixation-related uncharacterized protein
MKTTPRWMIALWGGIVVVAAAAFVFKMTEFALTLTDRGSNHFGGFGAIALGAYLLGMIPIVLLTLWGVFSGHFRDVERPKYRMLEMQEEIEAYGNRVPPDER